MDVAGGILGTFQPVDWFLAFWETTSSPWLDRLAPGRFKHISAFAYVPGVRVWVWYDAHWKGTSIILLGHDDFIARAPALTKGATVVQMKKGAEAPMPFSTRLGFYCVPSVKHLLGLRCVALTPDQFYRSVIRAGGTLISERRYAATAAGPAPSDRAGAG